MEKRSRRRIRDLVTQSASQGLSQNEIGCARISMMAKSTNALFTGRIQKRKTNTLHRSHLTCNTRPVHTASFLTCGRHVRFAPDCGPIAASQRADLQGHQGTFRERLPAMAGLADSSVSTIARSARRSVSGGTVRPSALAVLRLITREKRVGCSTGISPGFTPFRILSTSVVT